MIKPLLFLVVIAALAWQGYAQYEVHRAQKLALVAPASAEAPVALAPVSIPVMQAATAQRFQCDGRIHCSQMRSCDEATFFLKNCPGTKMDGDHDGIPCERGPCG